jgi:hypothetical protein
MDIAKTVGSVVEHPQRVHLLSVSSYLVDYLLASRLFPASLDVQEWFREN